MDGILELREYNVPLQQLHLETCERLKDGNIDIVPIKVRSQEPITFTHLFYPPDIASLRFGFCNPKNRFLLAFDRHEMH